MTPSLSSQPDSVRVRPQPYRRAKAENQAAEERLIARGGPARLVRGRAGGGPVAVVEEPHHGATPEDLSHLIGESYGQGEPPADTAELLLKERGVAGTVTHEGIAEGLVGDIVDESHTTTTPAVSDGGADASTPAAARTGSRTPPVSPCPRRRTRGRRPHERGRASRAPVGTGWSRPSGSGPLKDRPRSGARPAGGGRDAPHPARPGVVPFGPVPTRP